MATMTAPAVIWAYGVEGGYHDQSCQCDGHCRNCYEDLATLRALHERMIAEDSPAAPAKALNVRARYCSPYCRDRAKRDRALDRALGAIDFSESR